MARGWQLGILAGALGLVFQCDRGVRQWERELFRGLLQGVAQAWNSDGVSVETVAMPPPSEMVGAVCPDFVCEPPKLPVVAPPADFPGPGWYRVQEWRAWLPEAIVQYLATDYRFITDEVQWDEMNWGVWDRAGGPIVAADARIHTTDGVLLDMPPEPSPR